MTRVTQSMLSNNMLRNLNTSYGKMSQLQDQINSGRKFTRASQDPVAAIKGMQYRVQLDKIGQFQRNINEAEAWLDTTDTSLDQVGNALTRIKELVVQAANDTNTSEDRQKIELEIEQIRQQIQDLSNTQLGGKYIFSGTETQTAPFVNGALNPELFQTNANGEILDIGGNVYNQTDLNAVPQTKGGTTSEVQIEVFDGIKLTVNTNDATPLFNNINNFIQQVQTELKDVNTNGGAISDFLGSIANGNNDDLASLQGAVLSARADVGAKMNRVELMVNRLDIHEINVTKQKSENEDTDYAKTITEMATQESIHQAALSVGAKIIQQTLVDFMR